jgi:hypothetical protein
MKTANWRVLWWFLTIPVTILRGCDTNPKDIERPEKIHSKREVLYDDSTYAHLARLWNQYYAEYPSEEAYANWMYAARYAGETEYESRLANGLKKYPGNPTLLYLAGLTKLWNTSTIEARQLLEKSSTLDPTYADPWYGLIDVYMREDDRERTDVALRHLLESGAIADEVMDFSYNMLATLDTNAILITNGDNDTYPGWILTRIVGFRPDVRIVNRSLLNTEWYPGLVIREGVPAFVNEDELLKLRQGILDQMKPSHAAVPVGGPFGDTLIVRLIKAAGREARPVYFSCTMMSSDMVDRYRAIGRDLGLITLVTPTAESSGAQLRRTLAIWLKGYRTGGLDSWQLRHAQSSRAGKVLITNYASSMHILMDAIIEGAPDYRLGLFRWYREHLVGAMSVRAAGEANRMWCRKNNPKEIEEWCRKQGFPE